MHDLVYDLKRLAERHRSASYTMQDKRKKTLMLLGEQLVMLGYKDMRARDLKGRHVNKLLHLWQEQGLTTGTIKNRLAVLRFWAEKVDRVSVLPKTNAVYHLEPRTEVARISKATIAPEDKLELIADAYVRMSVALQRAFGLRREESIKFQPWYADLGGAIQLKGSWAKGGRYRQTPLTFPDQREVLEEAKRLVPTKGSALIPADKTYVEQLNTYTTQIAAVGLTKLHGLRHAHFQRRFLQLTGFAVPVAGGPSRHEMTPAQRQADRQARAQIAQEMGHGRARITASYFGR
jgi:hypothetical protein